MKEIRPGAKVRVWERIKEGDKERLGSFLGIVIARRHGSEAGASFTVRSIVHGVGVEKSFPIHSPIISKVDVISSPKKVSRSKLYYVRKLSSKEIRSKLGISL